MLRALSALALLMSSTHAIAVTEAKAALPTCEASAKTSTKTPKKALGDPKARAAAQKGLDFLARESKTWGDGHQCYGCHVHAVSLEAFVVGKYNQYDLGRDPIDRMLGAMTSGVGGTRGPVGLSYHDDSLLAPSKAFGGAALAHYDLNIDDRMRDDLIKTGRELLEYQQANGQMTTSWVNQPVGIGDTQTTYQAVQTWRQIYARTADDMWLTPIRKAEDHLRHLARTYAKEPAGDLQEMNYAALGLVEAGSGQSDRTLVQLRGQILEYQNKDGGFGFQRNAASNAFATGQTVYVLRQLGMVDGDKSVRSGTAWLVSHQQKDGGWSSSGSSKAEAMWGVLGLVSIDVLSIEVTGVADGRHVAGVRNVIARAVDNQGRGVRQIEMRVDDVTVARVCGDALTTQWSTESLSDGMHLLDFVAENHDGKIARRRVVVYAGSHFLTDVGSRFESGKTVLSTRNLAEDESGEVKVRIFETVMIDVVAVRGKEVSASTVGKKSGALNFSWDGKGKKGEELKSGRYVAELSYEKGDKSLQKVEHMFGHESLEEQSRKYGQVSGKLEWEGRGSANTAVELVDQLGNVVQSTTSTRSGQYRFKNVDGGKYKVRVKKKGFRDEEKEIETAAGEDQQFDAAMAAE